MADSERDERDSELESDTSSIDGTTGFRGSAAINIQHLQHRIESLQQENRVLRMELDTFKIRCKNLVEDNRELRRASVNIQARAEQEEEYISNKLLKKIQDLKKEKETLAMNYEQEEEYLTNDLSRKLVQLRQEKSELEQSLEKEQEYQINKLMKKIDKLEGETSVKQQTLDQLKREKVELENALEQEQESLVNRLWKRMDKLETEKRILQERLDQPVSAPPSPRDINDIKNGDTSANLTQHIVGLRGEVFRLRTMLRSSEQEHIQKMAQYYQEEKHIREENLRLQRRLQLETERREALCRNLSESESSLEMDDERHFNEMTKQHDKEHHNTGSAGRPRTVSSPIPYQSPSSSRPLSPGFLAFSPSTASCVRCVTCGRDVPQYQHTSPNAFPTSSPPVYTNMASIHKPKPRPSPDRFIKPVTPTEKGSKT